MTVSNLPIPPDDPRGHHFKKKKLGSLERPTLLQQPYENRLYVPQKSIPTASTQGTAWTHHTFTTTLPPTTYHSGHFQTLSCLPNRPRQPTAWHTYLMYFLNNLCSILYWQYTLTQCTVHTPHRSQYAAITLTTSCTASTYLLLTKCVIFS